MSGPATTPPCYPSESVTAGTHPRPGRCPGSVSWREGSAPPLRGVARRALAELVGREVPEVLRRRVVRRIPGAAPEEGVLGDGPVVRDRGMLEFHGTLLSVEEGGRSTIGGSGVEIVSPISSNRHAITMEPVTCCEIDVCEIQPPTGAARMLRSCFASSADVPQVGRPRGAESGCVTRGVRRPREGSGGEPDDPDDRRFPYRSAATRRHGRGPEPARSARRTSSPDSEGMSLALFPWRRTGRRGGTRGTGHRRSAPGRHAGWDPHGSSI